MSDPTIKDVAGSSVCSFCKKSAREIAAMIGADGSYICDECLSVCVDIIFKRFRGCGEDGEKLRDTKVLEARIAGLREAAAICQAELQRFDPSFSPTQQARWLTAKDCLDAIECAIREAEKGGSDG